MKAAFGALGSILIGGIVFLPPIGVVVVILGTVLRRARHISTPIHDALLSSHAGSRVPPLIAILVPLRIASLAGAVARTEAGWRVFLGLENAALSSLAVYPMVKQSLDDRPAPHRERTP